MRTISINLRKDENIIRLEESAQYDEIILELKRKMIELKRLYQNEKVPIRISGKILKNKEMDEIEKIIKSYIDVEVTFDIPKELGLSSIVKTFNKETEISETKFHRGSLRSGQKLEVEGSLVIIGDVNSGAEVMATDNIIVLGTLRGLAHAGAKGNKKAIIAASVLDAVQIRIANIVEELDRTQDTAKKQVYIYVERDKIKME